MTGTQRGTDDDAVRPRGDSGDSMVRHVLMLGCGKMGGALLQRWSAATPYHFTAISPSGRRILPEPVTMVRSGAELERAHYDVIIIALKPQMIADVLPHHAQRLEPDGLLVSLAAGTSCSSLAELAPGQALVRIMPNLPVSIGRGMSALFAGDAVTPRHRLFVEALMGPTGELLWADSEDELDRITAIAGSGPGYTFELLRAWSDAAEQLGFTPAQARSLVLATVRGSVELAQERESPLGELRAEVTSKKGTTEAGLAALNGDGALDERFRRTLTAAYERAVELR